MDEILCHVRTVLADPGKGNGFLLITDFIDILKSTSHLINALRGLLTDERYHFSSFAFQRSLNAENTGCNGLLAVRVREHGGTAALAYIQFNGAGFHAESASYQVFQIFAAACQHFMTKSISAYGIVIFADKSSLIIMNAFGNAYNNIAVFFEAGFSFFQKFFCIEGCFRKINKKRVIAGIFAGEGAGCCKPSGMTSHDLYDGHGFFLINIGIQGDFTNCGSHISGSTAKSRSVVSMHKIIVNGLRLSDNADVTANHGCVAGKLAHSIHGIVAADVEKPADIHLLKFAEKLWVYRIFQRFRKLIAAGTQVSAWGVGKIFQLFPGKCFFKVKDGALQKSFNTVYHAINMFDFFLFYALRNYTIKAAVDNCSRSAGLSDNQILFFHFNETSCCS